MVKQEMTRVNTDILGISERKWMGMEKFSFHFNPKDGNAKKCTHYCTALLILHASKVMLKILQARFQQYVNRELLDIQAGFRKGRGTRDQIANIC